MSNPANLVVSVAAKSVLCGALNDAGWRPSFKDTNVASQSEHPAQSLSVGASVGSSIAIPAISEWQLPESICAISAD
ncbi:hypothetical protein [uncultured Hyphomonas sp.]|uniref:hypothetical protein n=1 Tax=uncultured Hyphomonas sp. TaxID=225298 RepID=UPI0030D70944